MTINDPLLNYLKEFFSTIEWPHPVEPVSGVEKYNKTFALVSAVARHAADADGKFIRKGSILSELLSLVVTSFNIEAGANANDYEYLSPQIPEKLLKKIRSVTPEDPAYPYVATMAEIITGRYGELSDADFSNETMKHLRSWFFLRNMEMPKDGAELRYGWADYAVKELIKANTPAIRQYEHDFALQNHAWAMSNMGLPDRGLFDMCSLQNSNTTCHAK